METEHIPDEAASLRSDQKRRLKDKAEALLKAFEALEDPQTYAEADRAAKALMSINKALDQLHGQAPEDPAPSGEAAILPDMSDALRPVYAGIYRRLAKIDARVGRPSVYAELAAQLEASP